MDEDQNDMIGLPEAEDTSQTDISDDDTGAPQPPATGGVLLDNDEAPAADETKDEEAPAGDDPDGGDSGVDTAQPPAAQTEPPQPAPQLIADPGSEFVPKGDYAFDITLADGSVHHIATPEDVEKLPKDADFGTPANLLLTQGKLSKMMSGIDSERREFEAAKQQFDDQQAQTAALETTITTMMSEANYLESKGKLPPVAAEYENADWNDPNVAAQPGVKERLELLQYRETENIERRKAGLPPMGLMEAYTQRELEQMTQKRQEVKSRDAAVRKAKGAMVGGSGATAPNTIPDDLIVGEGGNIRDLNPAY